MKTFILMTKLSPEVARLVRDRAELGRAWLELSSATGSTGVLGVGATEPDHEAMAAARVVISDYLAANYRVADFTPRTTLSAVPETIALSGRDLLAQRLDRRLRHRIGAVSAILRRVFGRITKE